MHDALDIAPPPFRRPAGRLPAPCAASRPRARRLFQRKAFDGWEGPGRGDKPRG